ncbi:MAG: hypothetical protein HC822_21720 [Oscillochloris sp.]|nr:hypothetical protein [Oscillochloris sp.]
MLIDRDYSATVGRSTLIHELMHVFQNAFQVSSYYEYRWWKEATADWAIHYVENQGLVPNSDLEHDSAEKWLVAPQISLETWTEAGHQYGSYLLPFFLQARGQDAGAPVRQSFERAKSFSNSLENLNGLLAGGFATQFPEFTLHNINRPPVDLYRRYDLLQPSAGYTSQHAPQLGGDPYRAYRLDGKVGHLASHAFHFKFNDPAVRAVLFENPYPRSDATTAHVRAIYRADGDWHIED